MVQTRVGRAMRAGAAVAGTPLSASKVLDGTVKVCWAPDAPMCVHPIAAWDDETAPVASYEPPTRWPTAGLPVRIPRIVRLIYRPNLGEGGENATIMNDAFALVKAALEVYDQTYVVDAAVSTLADPDDPLGDVNQFYRWPLDLFAPTDASVVDYFATKVLHVFVWEKFNMVTDDGGGQAGLDELYLEQYERARDNVAAHYANFPLYGIHAYSLQWDPLLATDAEFTDDFFDMMEEGDNDLAGLGWGDYGFVNKGLIDQETTTASQAADVIVANCKTFFGLT